MVSLTQERWRAVWTPRTSLFRSSLMSLIVHVRTGEAAGELSEGERNGAPSADLRHTCASLLIAQGANVKAIQTQLGHSSAQVTLDRYGHLMPDEMDRLAASLDATRASAIANHPRPIRDLDPDDPDAVGHATGF
jgi:integrase